MGKRNYTIDLLRFFASSWVALFHFNEPFEHVDNFYRNFVKYGALGVPIFFVVSGYCIAMAAENSKSVYEFMTRRFFRIFPGYWFSLLIVMGTVAFHLLFFKQNSVTVLPKSFIEVLATVGLMTSPFSSVKTINWVYWSLTVELFFYISIGLSLYFKNVYRLFFLNLISLLAFFPTLANVPALFFLTHWAPFGMGLGLFFLESNKRRSFLPILTIVVNVVNLFYFHQFTIYTVITLLSFVTIAVSVFWSDIPENRISKLGDYAYGVYLLHVPIGVYIFNFLKSQQIQQNVIYTIGFDLFLLLLMLYLGSLCFRYLELPGINFGKKFTRTSKQKTKLTTAQI